jgi:diguanylate cyclase (GGDEF)-like protein
MFDDQYNFIDCNEEMVAMYGVTKEYYLTHFHDLSPNYQPDGSKSRDKVRDIMERSLNGEKVVMEWMHCTPAGDPIPCEITLTRVMYKGKYIGLGYVYDLRNVKDMEAKLQSVVVKLYNDPLTDIYNRRFFDENLKRVMQLLSRASGTLSLLLIDIDYFKKYNDTHGHIEGDRCLKTVAKTLARSVIRVDDFVARYGGEEFVVVLPNTDEKGAQVLAERLHNNIRNCYIPHGKSNVSDYVTISIGGVTGIVEHTQSGEDYIKRADEMLYLSKKNGRNQSSFSPLDVTTTKPSG